MAEMTGVPPAPTPVRSPTPPPGAPPQPGDPGAAHAGLPAAERQLTLRALLDAGCHFGHQTRRWDPRMKPYIFGERNGIHILNLDHTLEALREALDFLRETVAAGGKVLFVGTKRQAQASVRFEAERSKQYFANNRWLGGMLTNFRTVRKSIERYKERLELLGDPEQVKEHSKKELSRVNREVQKYAKALEGIKDLSRLPDAIFVIDVGKERIAVSEARRLGIPVVAVVDTNCSPDGIDFPVPGNDDAVRAIQLYCALAADACLEGSMLFNERVQAQPAEEAAAGAEPAAPSLGRVVVEITQPPRRGRGTHSAGGPHRGRREPEAPEAPAEPKA
jgi:small subunit ribosomal protein S2